MPAFALPDLGEGLTEAEVVAWHVKVGDSVTVDQNVVEVETAKAVVEVPVPFAGRVARLHADPGDVVAVGQPLVTVDATGTVGTPDAAASGSVLIGYGTSPGRGRRRRAVFVGQSARSVPPTGLSTAALPAAAAGPVPVASPLIRKLARDAGVHLAALRGSGAGGLITRRDVDAAIRARTAPAPAGLTRIPIKGARKAAADKFSRSRREIPEATVWVDVDATETVRLRAALNADASAPKISMLALLSRFAILGLRRFPELNARVEDDEITESEQVNLGFAAQTGRGLVVPVLYSAQALTLEELSRDLSQRSRLARDGKLAPSDMAGGTFTVNNYGVFGVDGSAAIINHPEVAILGIGRVIDRPWVVGGAVVPRQVAELTLAFDHRACDGGTAGGFLRFVADCLESPLTVLRHV
jgi:2-oxoisovalerate dehydrogenase E2 component (dihydrolipoyl transacylase)